MRILFAAAAVLAGSLFFVSCKSDAATKAGFCDTVCVKDSMKFVLSTHKLKPYVNISPANCEADSVTWGYEFKGAERQMHITALTGGSPVKINPAMLSCHITDTSYFWLSFNNCATGRGYLAKVRFNASGTIAQPITSAFNGFDPKFAVAEGLAVWSDRGNIFTEDMQTGKKAQMTFGQRLPIDYDNLHDFVDSISVTATKIWAKVLVDKDWKVFEKDITLK
ncbi:MAG: hypothetical protein EOO09_06640 [Chitinophagaceae bacterium]|nr:MAG: hypothetical protein EOO09_06640 [Chitinophagaceae bacterium]